MRTLPDDTILNSRRTVYSEDCNNFDDICFMISACPSCQKEKIGLTLLPVTNKELLPLDILKETQQLVLEAV